MLQALKEHFELLIFTSGQKVYMENIVEVIGPHFFDHCLHRGHCTFSQMGNNPIKDLRRLLGNRNLKDILIIDDKEVYCYLQYSNLVPIMHFEGYKSDTWLKELTSYLISFLTVDDVRSKIMNDFDLWQIEPNEGEEQKSL